MTTSTNSILCYGFIINEDVELPWKTEDYDNYFDRWYYTEVFPFVLYDYLLGCFEQYDTVGIDEEFDKMTTEGNTPYDVDKSIADIIERARLKLKAKETKCIL